MLQKLILAIGVANGVARSRPGVAMVAPLALLPTLTSLMSKTLALKDDLRMTASLPDVIVKVKIII